MAELSLEKKEIITKLSRRSHKNQKNGLIKNALG